MHFAVVVSGLSAVAPQDSDTALIVSWNPTAEVDVYRVIVTNYSLALVTDLAIPGDTISITVTDLGEHQKASVYLHVNALAEKAVHDCNNHIIIPNKSYSYSVFFIVSH